jgi:hypothetical protein
MEEGGNHFDNHVREERKASIPKLENQLKYG